MVSTVGRVGATAGGQGLKKNVNFRDLATVFFQKPSQKMIEKIKKITF